MVQKLQSNEYLKRYDNMAAGERRAYEERVGEWMRSGWKLLEFKSHAFNARLQNVQQVSAEWNDAECHAFEEGAKLLSALTALTDTWLPDMLYVKSAKRAIATMYAAISTVIAPENDGTADRSEEEREKDGVRMQAGEAKEAVFTVAAGGATSVAPDARPTDVTQAKPEYQQVSVELPVPVRPKHVDQYVHLLPEKTQEHAAQLKDLYRELDDARQKMGLLMDDVTASPADREAWAKKATSIDNKIRRILDELDAEWEKLVKSGRVVIDDLGNARVVDIEHGTLNIEHGSVDAEQASEEQAELTSEQKAKRRELRKWLVDTRRGNGDTREEHVKKWQEAFREFLALDGETAFEDEKVKAAAEHYGIDLTQISQISQKDQEAKEAEEKEIVKS